MPGISDHLRLGRSAREILWLAHHSDLEMALVARCVVRASLGCGRTMVAGRGVAAQQDPSRQP